MLRARLCVRPGCARSGERAAAMPAGRSRLLGARRPGVAPPTGVGDVADASNASVAAPTSARAPTRAGPDLRKALAPSSQCEAPRRRDAGLCVLQMWRSRIPTGNTARALAGRCVTVRLAPGPPGLEVLADRLRVHRLPRLNPCTPLRDRSGDRAVPSRTGKCLSRSEPRAQTSRP